MLVQRVVVIVTVLGGSMAVAQNIVHQPVNPNAVTPVRTSMGHISILVLPERIVRVAAGSDVMSVEWHDSSVFVEPLKAGQPTNLMVWTEHQFSTYELVAPGDVKDMSFVIDESATPAIKPPQQAASPNSSRSPEDLQRMTDSVIGTTLLEATSVVPRGVRPTKDSVTLLIKEVIREKNSLYVRFSVSNGASHPYRIVPPNVFAIKPTKNSDVLAGLKNLQIPEQSTYQFEARETAQIQVRGTALPNKDVQPGGTVEGVLTLETTDTDLPRVYKFVLGNDGAHRIEATAVL